MRLETKGHEIHYGWLIPDCVTQMTVMAAPRRTVALKVRPPAGAALPEHVAASQGKDEIRFERMRTGARSTWPARRTAPAA